MENASKLKMRSTLYEALPRWFFALGYFHNQGEAETLVLGDNLSGGPEHGGMGFFKEAIIGTGWVFSGSGRTHNLQVSKVRIFLLSKLPPTWEVAMWSCREVPCRPAGGRARRNCVGWAETGVSSR